MKKAGRIVKSLKKHKVYLSTILIILSILLFLAGLQSLAFFNMYGPRLTAANEGLHELVDEKTRRQQLMRVWNDRLNLEKTVDREDEAATRLRSLLRLLNSSSEILPRETIEGLISGLPPFREELPEAVPEIDQLVASLERLQDIYTVPYSKLNDDLRDPPWYLQPLAGFLADRSGYLSVVTFNQAMYLAQIGELGTARILLSGLHASAGNEELLGLIYYGLGRLQWEIFVSNEQRENYFMAIGYLRQSLQTDPDLTLSKRLLDYLLSLSQTNSFEASQGEPATPSEGEAGSEPEITPIF